MQQQFWHDKWRQNHIGFNAAAAHRFLTANVAHLGKPAQTAVFVPLCGKSVDMQWLAKQGFQVIGVELSAIAIRDFFSENALEPIISRPRINKQSSFTVWQAQNIKLLQGDFFALRAKHLPKCYALYDRAALIALPPLMRQDYVAHLNKILPAHYRALIISLTYPQQQKSGPPFSVAEAEMNRLFKDKNLHAIRHEAVLDQHPHFAKNGMTALSETVYKF